MSNSQFRPLMDKGIEYGLYFETQSALFVFGNANLSKEKMAALFPDTRFRFLKQVHGRRVICAAPADGEEADGHVTAEIQMALVSITADCIPVLLQNDSQIGALHAGWRGVAQNIVAASKSLFKNAPHVAVLGPHIRQTSFEVGLDVVQDLLAAVPPGHPTESLVANHADPSKRYFNLNLLIRRQLISAFPGIQILDVDKDTVTDHSYHSYRRGKDKTQRQYSFVMLKAPKPVGI